MNKEDFVQVEIEIVYFVSNDIITFSTPDDEL